MASERNVNVGVIGAGAIGLHHLKGFQGHPAARLAAIAESSPERGAAAAREFGVPRVYSDYRELLDDRSIEAVSIALPNALHAPVALAALDAGKHVLLEKPMATCAADAERIREKAESTGLRFMVGQNQRFTLEAQTLKQLAERGRFGQIYHARAVWMRRAGIPRMGTWFTSRQAAGGGCVYDIGVHVLDLALHLMGEFDAVSVSGQTYAHFGPRGLGEGSWGKSDPVAGQAFDVEDFATALVRLKSGRTLSLDVSWAAHMAVRDINGVELYGVEAGASTNPLRVYSAKDGAALTEEIALLPPRVDPDRMRHFIDVVLGLVEPYVDPAESVQTQRILDAIYRSAAEGREVAVAAQP